MSKEQESRLSKEQYAQSKSWTKKFPDKNINIKILRYHKSWKPLFDELFKDKKIENINKKLSLDMNKKLCPNPNYVFNAFPLTQFDELKVVIIGQDPYFGFELHDSNIVYQAMGLSFSVPDEFDIPSSLQNIYSNLIKYKHIKTKPKSGNLENWARQGCLMLNSALTVINGAENINCHKLIWKWFTDSIIKYISDKKEHVIFVLWGASALEKLNLIDLDKHEAIISSHPSGRSSSKPLKNYSAFNEQNHFGKINELLEKWCITPIDWNIE